MDERVEQLRRIVAKHAPNLDGQALSPEVPLSVLGIDSLGFIEMMFDIENEFDLKIPDTQLDSVKTIGDVLGILGVPLVEKV